jgi:hypothetical protein
MNSLNGSSRNFKYMNRSCLQASSFCNAYNEGDLDPRTSNLSNDRKFSMQDICPSQALEPVHQRRSRHSVDILTPKYLFSQKHPKKFSNSLILNDIKRKNLKKSCSLSENEELNSTRSNASQSRKLNDSEYAKSISRPKSKVIEDSSYCKHCLKHVKLTWSFPDNSGLESKIVEFVTTFIACWEPDWVQGYKIKICEECNKPI